ncbi:hypothetical protein BX616_000837 [Lobosporangium transversale]|uniref:RhoGAP-domain-containing protein n=1 Tax=Lobosporangium transversale TaxID=64571 RepID=A0A1Y2H0G4_9FUNG|nr:hypothetical protein BCR41DRAFT_346442 [Lobosporangium transversale]KAF9919149.1 hypothetical protein BX616_000837 [Lobosporangium transversale]ORZ28047.1 hypothetical protein BCR41DRAFT_346442 [Lobosporangium transversale]|eukprot:XP_021885750.1 hypothetical protein BCR41DRAFT_346442 [Lobosporangium transversale]
MSQATRLDQTMPQGAPDLPIEAALQQVTADRNTLRSQNDQLWKIIEKQRIIIQNLQKDNAKLTAERDLFRHVAAENESYRNSDLPQSTAHTQMDSHHQSSNKSSDRKAREQDTSSTILKHISTVDKDLKMPPPSLSSAPQAPTDTVQPQSELLSELKEEAQTPKEAIQPESSPLAFSNGDSDLNDENNRDNQEENSQSYKSLEDETRSQNRLDSDTQFANAIDHSPQQIQTTTASPPMGVDRDTQVTLNTYGQIGQLHSPASGSPTSFRNVSANLAFGPLSPGLPYLPPRSPRRERKDIDTSSSPAVSDNEDDSQPVSDKKSPVAMRKKIDQSSMSPEGSLQSDLEDKDVQVMSASKVSIRSVNAYESTGSSGIEPYADTGPSTRKNISAQIPLIPLSTTQLQGVQEHVPVNTAASSATSSPIAAIIDQDAEKFRMFMSKLSSPNRKNVSAPIQLPGGEYQDHATALGQAVAMENIQNQLEIQSQLLGQLQSHSGRIALNPVHGGNRRNVSAPIHAHEIRPVTSADSTDFARTSSEGIDQNAYVGPMDRSGGQLSYISEIQENDSVQTFDDYPKINARSTSHQRTDDDAGSGHGVAFAPNRQGSRDQQGENGRINRVASPTPSNNSSITNTLTNIPSSPNHSRPTTLHQQAFSMFADNLEFVSILVVGSNISTNDRGREQLTFLISIGQEVHGEQEDSMLPHKEDEELWRVEKQYSDFVNLDSKLRITQSRNIVNSLPKLPDKSLFSTHAPSKVDARKIALEQYLQQVTSLRIKDTRDLCEFLSTNVVEREKRQDTKGSGFKAGYLTKRGKNFGGWKTRYFVLRGPALEYFDTKDGHHLGSIALTNAQIGRQQSQDKLQEGAGEGANDPNSYRHAFLILEPKKGQTVVDAKKNPNSVTRHVLCAETDEERDDWVDALMIYVGKDPAEASENIEREKAGRKIHEIQKLSATPIRDLQPVKGNEKLLLNREAYERQQRTIPASHSTQLHSQGRNGSISQSPTLPNANVEERFSSERSSVDAFSSNQKGSNSQQSPPSRNPSSQSLLQEDHVPSKPLSENQSIPESSEKKQKSRMTFWAKKSTKEEPLPQMPVITNQNGPQMPGSTLSSQDSSRLRTFLGMSAGNTPSNGTSNGVGNISTVPAQATAPGPGSQAPPFTSERQVFGVSLEQAIEQAQIQPGYELPAVVYRCIEYLNAHKAQFEEGIYRLNGSAAVIKSLKERFNQEGDVPLLQEEEYYDIHAVAGLLKLFLRELPSSVLTRELHRDFLQVVELANKADRVEELTRLVASLPEANYTLLRALTAHLIEIVDNADINKMTARNVGIVFSPTLGIPAGVFALLMSNFDQIFHTNDGRIMPLENSINNMHQESQEITSSSLISDSGDMNQEPTSIAT